MTPTERMLVMTEQELNRPGRTPFMVALMVAPGTATPSNPAAWEEYKRTFRAGEYSKPRVRVPAPSRRYAPEEKTVTFQFLTTAEEARTMPPTRDTEYRLASQGARDRALRSATERWRNRPASMNCIGKDFPQPTAAELAADVQRAVEMQKRMKATGFPARCHELIGEDMPTPGFWGRVKAMFAGL